MRRRLGLIPFIILALLFLMACEESDDNTTDTNMDLYTEDINAAPQFFSFADKSFHQTTYDLSFELGQMVYLVGLNSGAGVLALRTDTLDFDTEVLPVQGYQPDSSAMVIGSSWMDVSSYNPTNHSISANGMIYFIRSSDYQWTKFRVISATPDTFRVEYAFYTEGAGYGSSQIEVIPYGPGTPALFSLSLAQTMEPNVWDICMASTPEYSVELGANFFMPTVFLNSQEEVQVGFQDNLVYKEVAAVPANLEWVTDSNANHAFGNGGAYQILVYHPEPPYNHKVLVEHPERIYFVRTSGGDYKLQFKDYSSGVVLFATDAL